MKRMLIFLVCVGGIMYLSCQGKEVITTPFGTYEISEPLVQELLQNPYVQRLKKVRQYGQLYYSHKPDEYTRYEHSLGVFALLRRFNAPFLEQIAGLLHDISHTVFSHTGDFLYASKTRQVLTDSYQDSIHKEFLERAVGDLLRRYGIEVAQILHKNKEFAALEAPLPDLCADRLEYNMQGALLEGILTQAKVDTIVQDLGFVEGRWVFGTVQTAAQFARVSLYLTQHVWGSAKTLLTEGWCAQMLERAVEIKLLTLDNIHYGTDDAVWEKMIQSDDAIIQHLKNLLLHAQDHFKVVSADQPHDRVLYGKFRGINPWVMTDKGIVRLTEVDEAFAQEFAATKKLMEEGWHVQLLL